MRIALVGLYPQNNQIKGGVEGVVHALAHQMASDPTLEVHVIAPGGSRNTAVEIYGAVTVHRLPRANIPGFISYWTIERYIIHRTLKSINPDIAHFHGSAGWLIGYNKPSVLTVHGIAEKDILFSNKAMRGFRSHLIRKVENIGRRHAHDVILISPYVRQELGAVLNRRQHAIENPIDRIFFDAPQKPEIRTNHLITVGNVSERKNTLGVLQAFYRAFARNGKLRLSVAGSLDNDVYVERCRNFIEENDLTHAVKLLGNLDRQNLARLYRTASCLLLLSRQETAPMVIAESMACGVPTIGSHTFGIPYMIDPEITGLIVDPDNEQAIVAAIERITLNSNSHFDPIKIAARARERFHPDQVVRHTLKVYDTALTGD